jgi:hypothetical protein
LIGWAWLRRTKFVLKNNEKDKKTFSTYRLNKSQFLFCILMSRSKETETIVEMGIEN